MIITRTPHRISLLGGGTDYSSWSSKHNGIVVGGAVNLYSHITARLLPPFHDFKSRIVYSKTEQVKENKEINHNAVRACISEVCPDFSLEILHSSDIPGRSGTGSSSTFVVGLINALYALQGRAITPQKLGELAIKIERNVLKEVGGLQDQVFAAVGGIRVIHFQRNGEIDALPLALSPAHIGELETNLMLFFTKMPRTSAEVAATYTAKLEQDERSQFAMMRLAELGVDAIYNKDWERLGDLVDQSWRIKSGLSQAVTNQSINKIYAAARLAGAFGGKLTGAGGGGCLFLVAPKERHARITSELIQHDCVHIPFKFEFFGSQIIFSSGV